MNVKVGTEHHYLPLPDKLILQLQQLAMNLNTKKQQLLNVKRVAEVKDINKSELMMDSLERNIFQSLKNSFLFGNDRQIKTIAAYVSKNPHAETILCKICVKYGLNLS